MVVSDPVLKFTTLGGGTFMEADPVGGLDEFCRCFKFDGDGRAEYAMLEDLRENGERARWYGHNSKWSDWHVA